MEDVPVQRIQLLNKKQNEWGTFGTKFFRNSKIINPKIKNNYVACCFSAR